MHVNGAAFQQVVGIPHGFHDALAGQNFFGMLQKEMQQRIFLKGQLHRLTVHRNGAGNVIQRDVSKPQGGGAGWCGAGAAQHRLDAADELHNAERLAEVIVCTVVQPFYHINLAGFGCDHDDWYGAGRGGLPQAAQNLVAVLIGQHNVQNHQVGRGLPHGSPEGSPVLKPADGVLVGLQSILLQLTDGCVIFNNIDHKILQTNRPKPAICHRSRPILQGKALR